MTNGGGDLHGTNDKHKEQKEPKQPEIKNEKK